MHRPRVAPGAGPGGASTPGTCRGWKGYCSACLLCGELAGICAQGTSNATIQLTGIVGLAAVVFGLYQLRGSGRRKPPGRRGGGAGGAWASAASSNSRPSHPPAAKLQGLPLDAPKAAAQVATLVAVALP